MKIIVGVLMFLFGFLCLFRSGRQPKDRQLWRITGIILISIGSFLAVGIDIMMHQITE